MKIKWSVLILILISVEFGVIFSSCNKDEATDRYVSLTLHGFSNEPVIKNGATLIIDTQFPIEEIQVNDFVWFVYNGQSVVHPVVRKDGTDLLITKGVNNLSRDKLIVGPMYYKGKVIDYKNP